MSFKEKLKTLLQSNLVKKTGTVFSLIAITSALAFGTIACTHEQNVQDPPSPPITTPSDDSKPSEVTPGGETTDDETTDPENPDITDPETPTEPEDPGITEPEDPDITEPTDPENPDITDPETPVDPEEPEIEDPTPENSFEEVYNEVFGENYEFVPFEDYMQSLAERVFSTSTDVRFVLAGADPDAFVIYADAVGGDNRCSLLQGTLMNEKYSSILCNFYDLTRQSEAAGGFKQYMQQVYESCADASSARAELETISTSLNQGIQLATILGRGGFDTTRPVTNTRDDIDFSAYAEKYTPEGATPLKCYVGSFKGYVYDDPLNPLFNTGYTIECPVVVIYSQDGSNQLIIESFNLRVPRHRDYTNEQMYAFGLGEINETYVKLNGETTVIDDPILSEELLANIENSL